jgi:hypothetical protein
MSTGTINAMTDRERSIIERKPAESRRLGQEADKAADKAIASPRRAARARRDGRVTRYASVGSRAHS